MNPILFFILFIALMFGLPHIMSAVFDKADNDASKGDGSCLAIIIVAVIIFVIICNIGQCSQSGGNYNHNNWEPRHTQNVKSIKINVNGSIFPSAAFLT
jgi:hypothetical protein